MITPKQAGFYMPPEWHPHARCWMAWPCHQDTWANIGFERARSAYAKVATAIAQFEPVTMIVHPNDVISAEALCGANIRLMPLAINDSWTRDTGPSFLVNRSYPTPDNPANKSRGLDVERVLAGVDWIHNAWGGNYQDCALDNQIAKEIINATAAQYFHAPLVMEGGSFHVDGEGTILTTRECLLNPNRNPKLTQQEIEHFLCDYLGGEKVLWLNRGLIGDETDGHVDEIACFIAPGKVLCLITQDTSDPNYELLQENYEVLKSVQDAKGRFLQVFTIEQPPATYLHGERLTLSYINFYLANTGLVIPAFGYEKYDTAARVLFQQLFQNHTISQIDALDVFAGGGGIHCITQQEPEITPKSLRNLLHASAPSSA